MLFLKADGGHTCGSPQYPQGEWQPTANIKDGEGWEGHGYSGSLANEIVSPLKKKKKKGHQAAFHSLLSGIYLTLVYSSSIFSPIFYNHITFKKLDDDP